MERRSIKRDEKDGNGNEKDEWWTVFICGLFKYVVSSRACVKYVLEWLMNDELEWIWKQYGELKHNKKKIVRKNEENVEEMVVKNKVQGEVGTKENEEAVRKIIDRRLNSKSNKMQNKKRERTQMIQINVTCYVGLRHLLSCSVEVSLTYFSS